MRYAASEEASEVRAKQRMVSSRMSREKYWFIQPLGATSTSFAVNVCFDVRIEGALARYSSASVISLKWYFELKVVERSEPAGSWTG